jgi:GDP-L-fucose synthase
MSDNVLVTGGQGMLGSCFSFGLKPSIEELDLRIYKDVLYYMKEHSVTDVIHCAAKVGGLTYNIDHNADMILENTDINNNVLRASVECGVKNVVSVLSTCIFPSGVQEPFSPEDIHSGPPHYSNVGYAFSKRMLLVLCNTVRDQYGINCTTVIPCNMFGPGDNFRSEESHVIPALIRKAYESKDGTLLVGGTGIARREFLYSKDCARIMEWMLKNYEDRRPLIVSPSEDVSILEVAKVIASKFDLRIELDDSIPDGQITKRSDSSLLESLDTGVELTDFDQALDETIDWFVDNYNDCRK